MPIRAGSLRPSQAVTQHGPGSLVDLPSLSMVVLTADEWDLNKSRRVDEPRLARRMAVDVFRAPPWLDRKEMTGGIPAAVFPTFLVCPKCRRLAHFGQFTFRQASSEFICEEATCPGKRRAVAYPARFMVACAKGHLDDFPWHQFVHAGLACGEELKLTDSGLTGSITDLSVECETHSKKRNLGQAFGVQGGKNLPGCSGGRPWRDGPDPTTCTERPRVLLRGASNAYFAVVESAISIPPWSDPLQMALGQYADMLAKVTTPEKLEGAMEILNAPELEQYSNEQIWLALERRRAGEKAPTAEDMRREEWASLREEPGTIDARAEFQSRSVSVHADLQGWVSRVTALERLREVRALRGFTRIDPNPDIGDLGEVEALNAGLQVSVASSKKWFPGVEYRGEGIFLELDEGAVHEWESSDAVETFGAAHRTLQERWNADHAVVHPNIRTPRFILLHSLAHMIIRRLALDCGYSGTSLRERLYSSSEAGLEMAGILIYTATPDSEGSLGGLVEMSRPEDLGPLISRALHDAHLCAGDPHCATTGPDTPGNQLNGAACHACLLISETSCEAGNRHLDRGLVVPTLDGAERAFRHG
jgi:hypothetical protein